nr:MAG: hypothetical protein [Rhabdoviridae sp.]
MATGETPSSSSVLSPLIQSLETQYPTELVPYSLSCSLKITTPPSLNYHDKNELFLIITPLSFMLTGDLIKDLTCTEDLYKILSGKLLMLSLLSIAMDTTSPGISEKVGNSYLITMRFLDQSEQLPPHELPYRKTINRRGAIVNKDNQRQRYVITYFGTIEVLRYTDDLEATASLNNYIPIVEVLNVDERLISMLKQGHSIDYIAGRKVFTNTMISYPQPTDLVSELCDNAELSKNEKLKILNTLKQIEGMADKPEVIKQIENFIPQVENSLVPRQTKPGFLKRMFRK